FDWRADEPPGDAAIDYGARLSVREMGSEPQGFHNYFQDLDAEKHLKIVEHQALRAIREFLDQHAGDTSEFSRRQTRILNYCTVQVGSNSAVGAAAFGAGGKAVQAGDIEIGVNGGQPAGGQAAAQGAQGA